MEVEKASLSPGLCMRNAIPGIRPANPESVDWYGRVQDWIQETFDSRIWKQDRLYEMSNDIFDMT
jgi:hypothetical protein